LHLRKLGIIWSCRWNKYYYFGYKRKYFEKGIFHWGWALQNNKHIRPHKGHLHFAIIEWRWQNYKKDCDWI